MPIPTLNTNYLVPNKAQAYLNAARVNNYLTNNQIAQQQLRDYPAEMEQKRKEQAARLNNYLLDTRLKEKSLKNYDIDVANKKEMFTLQKQRVLTEKEHMEAKKAADEAKLFLEIAQAPTQEIGAALANRFGIKDYKWLGNNVSFTDPKTGYTISGPKASVIQFLKTGASDPTWFTTEPMTVTTNDGKQITAPKNEHYLAQALAMGVTISKGDNTASDEAKQTMFENATKVIKSLANAHKMSAYNADLSQLRDRLTEPEKKLYDNAMRILNAGIGGVVKSGSDGDQVKVITYDRATGTFK